MSQKLNDTVITIQNLKLAANDFNISKAEESASDARPFAVQNYALCKEFNRLEYSYPEDPILWIGIL